MAEEEGVNASFAVAPVERLNALPRVGKQNVVARFVFLRGIPEIRQKAELEVFVPVGQKIALKPCGEIVHFAGRADNGRNDHNGSGRGRNAVAIVEPGKKTRGKQRVTAPFSSRSAGPLAAARMATAANARPAPRQPSPCRTASGNQASSAVSPRAAPR